MKDITDNEMKAILLVLKNPAEEFNARSMSKHLGISHMGALKIAKRLEKEGIFNSKKIGRAIIYKLNLNKSYSGQYVKFLLQRENESANPYVKRWINELRKITSASMIILFGSVISKYDSAKDIDVLIVIDKGKFSKVKKSIEEINLINQKKIHPIFQAKEDLKKNIKSEDKVILNAIRGLVVLGEDVLLEVLKR
ncbi:MAG: hypothetical protein KKE50_00585 [Nanoarchaeota archaeon]|nr:hypothetical protein [Nanoarchaeota archaeon]